MSPGGVSRLRMGDYRKKNLTIGIQNVNTVFDDMLKKSKMSLLSKYGNFVPCYK